VAVHDSHDPQWPFVGCIGYQVVIHAQEAQRPGSQIRAVVTLMRKRHHGINRVQNLRDYAVSDVRAAIVGNEFPNVIKVTTRFGMEIDSAIHEALRAPGGELGVKICPDFLAGDQLNLAALDVVIAAIERFANLRQFVEITGHGIFDQLVSGTPSLRYPLLDLGLKFRIVELHLHAHNTRLPQTSCQEKAFPKQASPLPYWGVWDQWTGKPD